MAKAGERKKIGFRLRRNHSRTQTVVKPLGISRREGEQEVATTRDFDELRALASHPNKHVRKNAEYKLNKLSINVVTE